MENEKSEKRSEAYKYFVIVPKSQHVHLQGWDNECKAKFKDDRFLKMMHDHLFVFQFESRLERMEKSISEIKELLQPKENKSGLFKK